MRNQRSSNSLTTFYIVRHGQTEWNVKGLVQGHTDIPLNETGEQQARELAKAFVHIHFDEVFSSDLMRAKRTAELITLEKQLQVKTTQALREKYYGSHEGMHHTTHRELYTMWKELTEAQKHTFKLETEESNEEAATRVITFLRETAVANPGKTILIVAHGGIMTYLLIHLGALTYNDTNKVRIKNGGYIKLRSDGVEFFIDETNCFINK